VTTGDDNQVGIGNIRGDNNVQGTDNHVVHGDGNTTAFGDGAATSTELDHVDVSGGGALSVAGDANGLQANQDSHDETTTRTTHETHIEDSGNLHTENTENSNNNTDTRLDVDSNDRTHSDYQSHNTFDHVDV
jgi:hypothetical protein